MATAQKKKPTIKPTTKTIWKSKIYVFPAHGTTSAQTAAHNEVLNQGGRLVCVNTHPTGSGMTTQTSMYFEIPEVVPVTPPAKAAKKPKSDKAFTQTGRL